MQEKVSDKVWIAIITVVGSILTAAIATYGVIAVNPILRYLRSKRRALSSRVLRPSWNSGSLLRLSMCSLIAARIISDTGRDSTSATVSRASACSADKRMVIALTGFI